MKSLSARLLFMGVLLCGLRAHAVTLPPGYQPQAPSPTVSVSVRTSGTPQAGVATVNDTQNSTAHAPGAQSISAPSSPGAAIPGSATADGVILYGPSPSVSAHALAQHTALTPPGIQQAPGLNYGYNDAGAGIQLYYFMAISGPGPSVSVNVNALLGASSSANIYAASGTAGFYVQKQGGSYLLNDKVAFDTSAPYGNVNVTGDNVSGYLGQFVESGAYTFQTGSVYVIGLTARATATDYGSLTIPTGLQAANAWVDPSFAIAATVPDAGSYQIFLSDGIGNAAPPVPEPPVWALLLGGVGCLVVRSRR